MFEAMIRQEIGFHDMEENRSSILSSKLSASVTTCKGLTSDKLSLFCQALSGVGFAIIYSFILNWKLALVMLTFVPITFVAGVISGRSSFSTKTDGRSSDEEGGRIVTETVENIKTIISLGRERHFLAEFKSVFSKGFGETLAMLHVGAFFYSLSYSILFFVQVAAFSFGFHLIKTDGLTVTDLFKIYGCLTFSSMILGRVYSQLPDQKKAKDGAKTAFRIIERKSKIDPFSEEGLKPDSVNGEVRFENVHFHYPNRPDVPILKGFDLVCKKGETNALVGPSGCGKSTTIALLLRFYDVESGTVYLDGNDIRKLNVNWLRAQIGLVSQEPTLFNCSIYENICFGDVSRTNIPMNEISDVCNQANIASRIESLPEVICYLYKIFFLSRY
jgi:ABC-type multidrug transport system fused ATPase/permease subunit